VRKFHGTKVLGTFAPEERKFQGYESSIERKFLDFSLPGSESAEKRKGQIPRLTQMCKLSRIDELMRAVLSTKVVRIDIH